MFKSEKITLKGLVAYMWRNPVWIPVAILCAIQFPFFIIHELSHIITMRLFGLPFKAHPKFLYKRWYPNFNEEAETEALIFYEMEIETEVDYCFGLLLSSLMPSIIWYLSLIGFYLMAVVFTPWYFIGFVLTLVSHTTGTSSARDLELAKTTFFNL